MTDCIMGISAKEEFPEGRIMWLTNGLPIDAHKPAALGECVVLGCGDPCQLDKGSCFCEKHRKIP